jgi:FkbM family methyltransferase
MKITKEIGKGINSILNKFGFAIHTIPKHGLNDLFAYLKRYEESFKKKGYNISIENNEVSIDGNGLKIRGDSANTFWTADAVLCKREYDFYSPNKYVMIDVGLNIGITSLAFARKEEIERIYGFEPFYSTFIQAQKNLELNPELSKKIEIFNFGLGCCDEKKDINYNSNLPGAMSSVKNIFNGDGTLESIQIKESSSIISEIINKHDAKIFLKIDCEGAEDEILINLDQNGILKKVEIICMEWHFKEPKILLEILNRNNFIVFNEDTTEGSLGFIRAIRVI